MNALFYLLTADIVKHIFETCNSFLLTLLFIMFLNFFCNLSNQFECFANLHCFSLGHYSTITKAGGKLCYTTLWKNSDNFMNIYTRKYEKISWGSARADSNLGLAGLQENTSLLNI